MKSPWYLVLISSCWMCAAAAFAQSEVNRRFTETSLGAFPPAVRESALLSPDGRHVAYVELGETQRVVLDGKPQPPYDQVAGLEFSPDGKYLAYAAKRDDRWLVVVDGRESPSYQRVGMPRFSPDGKKLAHVALLDVDKRTVVVNRTPGRPYDVISAGLIEFSPDGSRMAYGAVREDKCYLVVDGEEIGPYDDLGTRTGYRFSADGTRLAFVVLVGEQLHVVVDGAQGSGLHEVGDFVFSPDGRQTAYTGQETKGGPWFVFLGSEKQGPFETIGDGSLAFNSDGSRLAYSVRTKGRWSVVVDGQPGEPHEGVAEMRFSPDGKRLAYVVQDGQTESVFVDGQLQRSFEAIGGGSLVFSPDSRKLGYIARNGYARFVVINGTRKPRRTMVAYLNFSPDSRRYGYVALDETGAYSVVDDRPAAHRYESIWNPPETKLLFDYRDQFHYLGVREDEVFLVEEKVE